MKKRKIVEQTNYTQIESSQSYWPHAEASNRTTSDGELMESVQANPDSISDEAPSLFSQRSPNNAKAMQIMDRAVNSLPAKLRERWIAFYRDQKTEEEIGLELGLDQSAISRSLAKAYSLVVKYCDEHSKELDNVEKDEE